MSPGDVFVSEDEVWLEGVECDGVPASISEDGSGVCVVDGRVAEQRGLPEAEKLPVPTGAPVKFGEYLRSHESSRNSRRSKEAVPSPSCFSVNQLLCEASPGDLVLAEDEVWLDELECDGFPATSSEHGSGIGAVHGQSSQEVPVKSRPCSLMFGAEPTPDRGVCRCRSDSVG